MPALSGTLSQLFKAGSPHATRRSSLSSSVKPYTPNFPTKDTRRKRSKSVTFSGVDMVFELNLPSHTVASRSHTHYTDRDNSSSRARRKHFSMPLVPSNLSPCFSQRRHSSPYIRQDGALIRASQSRERRRKPEQQNIKSDDGAHADNRGRRRQVTSGRSVDHKPNSSDSQIGQGKDLDERSPRDLRLTSLGASPSSPSRPELLTAPVASVDPHRPHPPAALSVAAPAVRYRHLTHSDMGVSSSYTPSGTPSEITWPVRHTQALPLRTSYPALPRTYIVRTLNLSQSGCVTMLDAGIDRLIPPNFHLAPTFKPSNIRLQTTPRKGLGLFSYDMVYPGEVLFAEHPILVLPYALDTGVPLKEAYEDMLSRLPAQTQQELLYLSQSVAVGAHTESTSAHNIISRINPFAIPLSVPSRGASETEMHRGVFLKMSRCNHSCGPNAVWQWNPESFSLILTAVRYINPGEEITIAYTDVTLPQHERRFNLRRSFGFRCACEWCTLDHRSVLESDAARFFLSTFWHSPSLPSFKEWCQEEFYPSDALISNHQRALRYIQREGLEILSSTLSDGKQTNDLIRHIDAISMCYAALEDVDEFAIWTRRAAEAREAFTGLGPDRKLLFSKWLSNPSSFPLWGAKKTTHCRG